MHTVRRPEIWKGGPSRHAVLLQRLLGRIASRREACQACPEDPGKEEAAAQGWPQVGYYSPIPLRAHRRQWLTHTFFTPALLPLLTFNVGAFLTLDDISIGI
eukprot:NODE_1279_length_628_cov_226.615842_g1269_i0.p1 GENE.NODE_1279_length_628_cov_226.615842_g1269_i0~~NODE_1279_length_628_cov_226.615842_g1269_i0.p1  ORF type:complete len:102 (+),score=5.55 NODE_1279_length_628_cov_226.615842_g1269_i0:104-409(+)